VPLRNKGTPLYNKREVEEKKNNIDDNGQTKESPLSNSPRMKRVNGRERALKTNTENGGTGGEGVSTKLILGYDI